MKMKKILAIVLSLIMIVGSMATVAAEGTTETSTHSRAYTSADTYWGQCWGSADESFEFKFYNNDTYMGYTSLINVGGIIDGDVEVSWHISLGIGTEEYTSDCGYWKMKWDVEPTLAMQPTRVEHWVDGVKAAECALEPNWADSILPVIAAVTDDSGKILSYVNNVGNATLANAFSNGGNVALLKNVTLAETLTIPANTTVTLDLNGKTASMNYATDITANHTMISNNGVLTVQDGADGGKLSYKYTGANAGTSYSANTITTNPGSTLTVKSGTIENLTYDSATIAYAVDGLTNGGIGDVTVNIDGGNIKSERQAIRIFANSTTKTGTLNISNGDITGRAIIQNANAKANKAALNITDGIFNANEYKTDVLYVGGSNGATIDMTAGVSVSGGTFNGEISSSMSTQFISGGTFSSDVSEFLIDGFEIKDNGDGTYGVQEKNVAKVGDTYYDTLTEAMGKFNGRTVEVLCDVEESIEGFYGVTLTTNVPGGVTITNTNTDWVDFDDVTVGAGVTVEIENPYSGDSENIILGTLVAGDTYYHAYDAKTTIKDGGNVVVKGTTILRYNKNTDAGIYIYGDGDDSTVEFDCDYYIGSYSGTLYAENANIEAGYYLLKNSYDNSDYADMYLTLDNSTITVVGTTDTQDSFIIDDQIQLVLKNGSSIEDVRDFNILSGANLTFSMDAQSTISATYMNIADGVPFEAKKNADGTYGIMNKIESDLRIGTKAELLAFAEEVNAGNNYSGKIVVLMNNIDMEWTGLPIGTKDNPFKGTFDGQNHIISNYTYHYVDETTGKEDDYVGLFGKMVDATIKNVTVHNPTIEGGAYVAGIVGQGYTGTIDNCHVTGEIGIEGNYMVAGISGQGYANISNCSVIGEEGWDYNIICATYLESDLEGDKVGGIVGHCAEGADVTNCTVKNVEIVGTRNVAGIAGNGFESSDFINCTVENVTIGTNATAEYADANKDSMCIGGIVGIFAKGDYTGGTVSNAKVSNVTFTNENSVTVSAGAITGGHRGASKTEAPYAPADNTAINNTVTNITGATNTFMETVEPTWFTNKDAGFYMVSETEKAGVMRFLFLVDVDEADITETGIKYIKAEDITDKVNANGTTVTGNKAAFYGDVTGVPNGTEGTYIAVAYVKTANGTFWSETVECSPDFTKHFTEYKAQ